MIWLFTILTTLLLLRTPCDGAIQNQNADSVLVQYEARLAEKLGYPSLTPEVDTLIISPDEMRECVESDTETCYDPVKSVSII